MFFYHYLMPIIYPSSVNFPHFCLFFWNYLVIWNHPLQVWCIEEPIHTFLISFWMDKQHGNHRHSCFWLANIQNMFSSDNSNWNFNGVRVTWSIINMCMFCRSLFVFFSFFFWSLWCLSFDLRIMITSLVSSN